MPTSDGEDWIFTKTIRTKGGKVLVAAHYGLQAFRIRVRRKKRG